MENLNAETVKKALECCSADTTDCHSCPYSEFSEFNCFDNAKKDALALINSQEQRIKELAEEVESLKQAMEHEHASFMETFGEYGEKCDKLTEENERLREDNNQWTEKWADNQRRWENLYRQLKIENEMLLTHIPIPKEMLEEGVT